MDDCNNARQTTPSWPTGGLVARPSQLPILLQILCCEHLVSLEEGELSDDWQEEALAQIQPFTYLLEEMG